MEKSYFQDEQFNAIDFTQKTFQKGDYDNCVFSNCNFAETYLNDIDFEECIFNDCDFSNANIANTAFKSVKFNNCKLVGLQFDECNPFLLSFQFTACQLNLSGFYQLKMKDTYFQDCMLHEVDFTETELTGSTFKNCDFSGAMFGNTNLEKADLRTSFNFDIDPESNRLKGARFSYEGLPGLLSKYGIKITRN